MGSTIWSHAVLTCQAARQGHFFYKFIFSFFFNLRLILILRGFLYRKVKNLGESWVGSGRVIYRGPLPLLTHFETESEVLTNLIAYYYPGWCLLFSKSKVPNLLLIFMQWLDLLKDIVVATLSAMPIARFRGSSTVAAGTQQVVYTWTATDACTVKSIRLDVEC